MTQYKNLLLNNQLCFSLYAATNSIIRYYRIYLNEIGITYTQYLVLLVLWEEESCHIKKIAEILKLDSPTITPIVQKLEKMNLVKRQRKDIDERMVTVSLTKDGLDLEGQVADIQNKVACKTHLKTKEFNDLKGTLNKLAETMEQKEKKLDTSL
ncbi:MarR family transcriptional regulator [Methylophilaceae bacterium]|jgi:DNA-binding MarR family transcriptional regulator|nr:MarR family transcriptional regulator [Methylophilaceae bacterium]|tara:strand:+ start:161 stop:622 length:462 start_codon:yes stop_codon:yes gene_type:complete